ncbi:thioredoxin [Actinokineospora enzanensis]|uniref:thioredoxin n=1 Tax=Actinokineospora enzanensis TaxID=155975 RepID=UPI0003683C08|nr:thioredoxin [Actinokineospora enzanensis]
MAVTSDLVTVVTEETFAEVVLGSDKPVLVDFWAQWCPPCHMIAPVLAEIAAEQVDTLRVCTVNADENPGIARDYQVMSMPTLMVFRDGVPVRSYVGARPKVRLVAELADALR